MTLTRTAIKLRKCENREAWMLYLEANPVYVDGKKKRVRTNLKKTITSAMWSVTSTGKKQELRDKNGVIRCKLRVDSEACEFAENVRRKAQQHYDAEYLKSDEEKAIRKLREAADGDFIDYMDYERDRRHRNSSESISINWRRAIELLR